MTPLLLTLTVIALICVVGYILVRANLAMYDWLAGERAERSERDDTGEYE